MWLIAIQFGLMNAAIFVDSVGAPSGVLNLVIPVTLIHVVAVINVVVLFVSLCDYTLR